MTLLYTDPLFLLHQTGPHPECPQRLQAITARLEAAGLPARCQAGVFEALDPREVAQLHDQEILSVGRRQGQSQLIDRSDRGDGDAQGGEGAMRLLSGLGRLAEDDHLQRGASPACR